MATSSLHESGFWLPTRFPSGRDECNVLKNTELEEGLCFPTEFPYEIDWQVESMVMSSIETESNKDDDKQRASARSPQSTLSGIGSPNGTSQVSSPPTTPFGPSNETWELIYAAAGQVARLKMSAEAAKSTNQQIRGIIDPPRSSNTVVYSSQSLTPNLPQPNQFHHRPVWFQNRVETIYHENRGCCGRLLDVSPSAWPALQPQRTRHSGSVTRAQISGGSVSKRACAGTGVFLPRGHNISPPNYRNKGGCSPVLVPAKVVQALNLNFTDMPFSNGAFAPDHEAMMSRRNALLAQQRRSTRPSGASEARPSHEAARLPQEWTY